MADSGSSARVQGEVQKLLNKINEERDLIQNLLDKWVEKADAVASHASSALANGPFVGPFIDGCTALDGMFTKLSQVSTFLTEGNDSHPDHPSGPHRLIAQPSPLSGAKLPPECDTGSCQSGPPPGLNGPWGASPSVTHESPKPESICFSFAPSSGVELLSSEAPLAKGHKTPGSP